MVALVNSPYPITALFSIHRDQTRARLSVVRCSVRVSLSLPLRRVRRRNSLRPKILKTLNKPYPDSTPDGKSDFGVVEELETSVGVNEGGLGELEVVKDTRGANVMYFKGVNGWMVFKVVVSFVGLFILQTVVSVWIMGYGDSSEKDDSLGNTGRNAKGVGFDGDLPNVDEWKIAVIRRMAREVREAEKRKSNRENGEADVEDESGDDEDDNPMRKDIAKEIDGRLTMLRKRSPIFMQNVNLLKNAGGSEKEVKNESVDGKEEDNRLMFEAKRKFRSHMAEHIDKPKGFEGIDDLEESSWNMNEAKSEKNNIGMGKDKEKPLSQKRSSSEKKNKGKAISGSLNSRSDSSINGMSKAMNKGGKPESGVIQDSSNRSSVDEGAKLKESTVTEIRESQRKMNDLNASTSKMDTMSKINGKSDSGKLKSTNKDNKSNDDPDIWWSTLPYVFVILMQKGDGSEVRQGFYTLHINSDAQYESSYTVAFEDQSDARNFSYILESTFEDLRDAVVDVALMSIKELNEMVESVNNNVVVVRKGELKLYAGQPLDDAEFVLKLLVK